MAIEKSKKGGKKEEPSWEELEFIYIKILEGLSDSEILVDMQGAPFLRRTAGFIKRRRKEFDVAKKVIAKHSEGAYDIDTIERQKKHWSRLSDAAEKLITSLQSLRLTMISDATILEVAVENEDFTTLSLLDEFRTKCLLSHLQGELKQLEHLTAWGDLRTENITVALIDKLSLIAERGEFHGKCEVCKDWD